MSIKAKFLVLILSSISIYISILLYSVFYIRHLSSDIENINITVQIEKKLKNIQSLSSTAIEAGFQGAIQEAEKEAKNLEDMVKHLKSRNFATELDSLVYTYLRAVNSAVSEQSFENIKNVAEAGKKTLSEFENLRDKVLGSVKSKTNLLIYILVSSAIVVASVFSVLGFWLAQSISSSIRRISKFLKELAMGGADLTRRIKVSGNDETAELSRNFNEFVDALSKIILDLRKSSEDVFASSRNTISSIDKVTENFSSVFQHMARISTAVNEFSSSLSESARNTTDVSAFINQLNEKMQSSSKVISSSLASILSIREMFKEISDRIRKIEEDSKKIQKIVSSITDISDQTNLLALNASIEASRAGEKGKGFSIVADEVRKLANRTRTLANEISALVSSFSDSVEEAIKKLQSSEKVVSESVSKAEQGAKALNEMLEGTFRAQRHIVGISTSIEQQSKTSLEISRSIEEVSALIEKAREVVEEMGKGAEELRNVSQKLEKIVNMFKI